MAEIVLGIDFGTTKSVAAVYHEGAVQVLANSIGSRSTPSCVFIETHEGSDVKSFSREIGEVARQRAVSSPHNIIWGVKQILGRSPSALKNNPNLMTWNNIRYGVRPTEEDKPKFWLNASACFHPEEIASMIIAELKTAAEDQFECEIKKAVVSVPSYFNSVQRRAISDAGFLLGLESVQLVNETSAAAVDYAYAHKGIATIFIVNVGGGRGSMSVLRVENTKVYTLASSGVSLPGGQDFDARMIQHLILMITRRYGKDVTDPRCLQIIRKQWEGAKERLSRVPTTIIKSFLPDINVDFETLMTRSEFENQCGDLFQRLADEVPAMLKMGKVTIDKVDVVLLTGGFSRVPFLRATIQKAFSDRPLSKAVNPDEVVARGAALIGARCIQLIDVTPLYLSIHYNETCLSINPITVLPHEECNFQPIGDVFTICQGNEELQEIIFEGNVKRLSATRISGFKLDENGFLHLSGEDGRFVNFNFRETLTQDSRFNLLRKIDRQRKEEVQETQRLVSKNALEEKCHILLSLISDKHSTGKLNPAQAQKYKQECESKLQWLKSNQQASELQFYNALKGLEDLEAYVRLDQNILLNHAASLTNTYHGKEHKEENTYGQVASKLSTFSKNGYNVGASCFGDNGNSKQMPFLGTLPQNSYHQPFFGYPQHYPVQPLPGFGYMDPLYHQRMFLQTPPFPVHNPSYYHLFQNPTQFLAPSPFPSQSGFGPYWNTHPFTTQHCNPYLSTSIGQEQRINMDSFGDNSLRCDQGNNDNLKENPTLSQFSHLRSVEVTSSNNNCIQNSTVSKNSDSMPMPPGESPCNSPVKKDECTTFADEDMNLSLCDDMHVSDSEVDPVNKEETRSSHRGQTNDALRDFLSIPNGDILFGQMVSLKEVSEELNLNINDENRQRDEATAGEDTPNEDRSDEEEDNDAESNEVQNFQDIFNFIKYHKYPLHMTDKTKKRNLRKKCKQFTVNGKQLLKKTHRGKKTIQGRDTSVFPKYVVVITKKKEQLQLIKIAHEGSDSSLEATAMSGHKGENATVDILSRRAYWPNIPKDVKDYVKSCDPCQRVEVATLKVKAPLKSVPPPRVNMTQIGIDIISLPEVDGYKYAVIAVDYLSKFCHGKALKTKSAAEVADFILEWICLFGCPTIVINDQGREFCNSVADELHKLTGIKQRVTSAYNPQANGQVERENRVIKSRLLKVLRKSIHEWPAVLNPIMFGIRTQKQKSTGYSPFFLLFGQEPVPSRKSRLRFR